MASYEKNNLYAALSPWKLEFPFLGSESLLIKEFESELKRLEKFYYKLREKQGPQITRKRDMDKTKNEMALVSPRKQAGSTTEVSKQQYGAIAS